MLLLLLLLMTVRPFHNTTSKKGCWLCVGVRGFVVATLCCHSSLSSCSVFELFHTLFID